MPKCSQCGEELCGVMRYCSRCGAKQMAASNEETEQPPSADHVENYQKFYKQYVMSEDDAPIPDTVSINDDDDELSIYQKMIEKYREGEGHEDEGEEHSEEE